MMKGITNAEIREKFEHIESELQQIKKHKQGFPLFITFFLLSTLTALLGIIMMILDSHPLFLFFTVLGISFMIILVIINQWTK